MDTLSQPVKNIMRTGEWKDAHAFRVACDCHSNQHDLDVWVEVVPELDCDDITVTFYKDIYVPFGSLDTTESWKPGVCCLLDMPHGRAILLWIVQLLDNFAQQLSTVSKI